MDHSHVWGIRDCVIVSYYDRTVFQVLCVSSHRIIPRWGEGVDFGRGPSYSSAVKIYDDNDESYSIRHWTDVPPGEVCFGHHRGVDSGPGHFWRVI